MTKDIEFWAEYVSWVKKENKRLEKWNTKRHKEVREENKRDYESRQKKYKKLYKEYEIRLEKWKNEKPSLWGSKKPWPIAPHRPSPYISWPSDLKAEVKESYEGFMNWRVKNGK